ncbi:ATP-binding protein [Puniceibacterium sp. IMCC21224]|uniref:ATP-binding protein n=1 Tax=Puniceibacterium sp. IMCC21224 TaxID=1618204 RepID=UPI001E540C4D|nr:ATP-binding protein [Puniceibacterium sp. IMCC21224]
MPQTTVPCDTSCGAPRTNAEPVGSSAPEPADEPDILALELILNTCNTDVRACLVHVESKLSAAGLPPDVVGKVEVALAEALNNIVEHAFPDEAHGKIRLHLSLAGATLTIALRDDGVPLPGLTLPAGKAAQIDVPREDLPEGGFGWFLIRSLSSGVTYTRQRTQNHLTIRFDLGNSG